MSEHTLSALAGAYVLDALDEHERTLFEAHVATCADCAGEVSSLRAAATALSLSTVTTPPPALRAQVLSTIAQVRPLPPVSRQPLRRQRHWLQPWYWPAVAAACAVVAVIALGWGYQQHRDAGQRDQRTAALVSLLGSADAATVSGRIGDDGHVTLLYSKQRHQVILIGDGLPALSAGKTYQLWMLDAQGAATSAGLFTPDGDGRVLVEASGDLQDTVQMGISVERAGGAQRPTPSAIVALMPV